MLKDLMDVTMTLFEHYKEAYRLRALGTRSVSMVLTPVFASHIMHNAMSG